MEHNTDRAGDLEVQDNCPYQPQDQLGVPVCYVIVSDVDQLDLKERNNSRVNPVALGATGSHVFRLPYLPVFEEVQCYLYILQFVESHVAFFSGLKMENRC